VERSRDVLSSLWRSFLHFDIFWSSWKKVDPFAEIGQFAAVASFVA
jgi:hypothetical protein